MIYRNPEARSQSTELKRHLATAMEDEQKLYQRYFDAEKEVSRWRQRAEFAVVRGEEELARGALERSNRHAARAAEYHRQYLEQKGYVESMKSRLRQMETGLRPRPAVEVADIERSLRELDRLEIRAREDRAMLSAWMELERDELAEKLAALEREDQLDRQLAELKLRLSPED